MNRVESQLALKRYLQLRAVLEVEGGRAALEGGVGDVGAAEGRHVGEVGGAEGSILVLVGNRGNIFLIISGTIIASKCDLKSKERKINIIIRNAD